MSQGDHRQLARQTLAQACTRHFVSRAPSKHSPMLLRHCCRVCSMGQDSGADRQTVTTNDRAYLVYTLSGRSKKPKSVVKKDKYGLRWWRPRQCQHNASKFASRIEAKMWIFTGIEVRHRRRMTVECEQLHDFKGTP